MNQRNNGAEAPPAPIPPYQKRRPYGHERSVPNAHSPHKTPATVIYDQHWRSLDLIGRWNWDRYVRLCSFLSHTPYELGSLVMLSHKNVDLLKQHNRLVVGLGDSAAQPVALVLTLLEAHVLRAVKSDAIQNPFPQLKQ